MWLLYNLLLTLLAPLWVPWMLWRTHRRGEKPNWRERQGDYRESIPKKGDRPRLWVHAVSVGEFVAAQPLLRALRREMPGHEIVLSVTTTSGHQTAREAKERLYDYLVYLPIDVPRFTLNAMHRVRPDALIVMETELWMNLFWAAETFDVKTYVVNARISDRSFPRAKRVSSFYRAVFRMVDGVMAQTEEDAARFRALGGKGVETTGNLKFDQALEGLDDATDWRTNLRLDERPVVVIGSLRAEEFDVLADVIAHVTSPQWIVAPRHLERTPEFIASLEKVGLDSTGDTPRIGRRSKGEHAFVTVLDTYGELARVYRVADVAIIGGSFAKIGMQNPIQAMAFGKPVLHGPHTQNQRDVADLARNAGASIVCADGVDLARQLASLLEDPARRAKMGEAGRMLVESNVGAADRMARLVAKRTKA